MPAILFLMILSIIMHAEFKKTDNSFYTLIGIILSVVATIIIMILIASKDSTGVGAYEYYVNGVKVSSGFAIFTENFALTIIMGAVDILGSGIIGYSLGKKLPKKFFGSKLSLVIFIILSILGVIFAYAGVTGLMHTSRTLLRSNIISIIFGIIIILVSIFGFIKYKKEKK